jgi:hypothetical protein
VTVARTVLGFAIMQVISRDPQEPACRRVRARARLHSGAGWWTLVSALSAAISAALIGGMIAAFVG